MRVQARVTQRVDVGGVGITLEAAVCLGSSPIYEFGTPDQKSQWLPDLVAGRKLWAFGLTEPEAGSDAGATKTRAESRNGKWVINGAKQFITNCGTDISAGVTITAVTGRSGQNGPEISAIMVPTGTSGYHVLEPYRKLGWHSSDTHPLSFEDCAVPASNLLGERGGGYRQFLHTLTGGRIAIAALWVRLAVCGSVLCFGRPHAGSGCVRRSFGAAPSIGGAVHAPAPSVLLCCRPLPPPPVCPPACALFGAQAPTQEKGLPPRRRFLR